MAAGNGLLAGIVGPALLATGRAVDIAPAVPDDAGRVRSFYQHLSDTSTYYRFFGIRRAMPDAELRAVVTEDLPRHIALLASLDGELIGIGEFIAATESGDAEVAFAVADEHHREGVATLLLEALARIARRCGLRRLVARTLPGNFDMLLVFRTVGLAEQTRFDDGIIDVTLDLSSLDDLEHAAAVRRRGARAAGAKGQ